MTLPRGESAATLRFLIDELMADGSLDDDDLARIAQATATERERVLDDKAATLSAHQNGFCDICAASKRARSIQRSPIATMVPVIIIPALVAG